MAKEREDEKLDHFIKLAADLRGHMCLGLPLGVKMATKGLELMGIDDESKRDNLMVVVENNKCPVDGIQVVTGCTAGSRKLTVYHYGKSAAVFYDGRSGKGYRVMTKPDFIDQAVRLAVREGLMKEGEHLEELSQLERKVMMNAFMKMSSDELLDFQSVVVHSDLLLPSRMNKRTWCSQCGEEIMDGQGLERGKAIVCGSCYHGPYYDAL